MDTTHDQAAQPIKQPANIVPLHYQPSFEVPEDDEAETQARLNETLLKISATTFEDSGHASRSVHSKSHGLLKGELTVLDGLPEILAQGLFATPGTYPVVIRLSTPPGDMLDDAVSVPRAMALKVIGVDGARLAGSEGDVTQDFLMANGPAFNAPGPKKFLGSLKLLAATTDKAPGLKKVLSAVLQGTEKVIEAVGGESATIKAMGGHPETEILGETFFTQVPILFGPYMAKVSVAPVSSNLKQLTAKPLDLTDKPNGLRDSVVAFFGGNTAEWELRVQLCTDLEKMPIEDASVAWPEEESAYVAVARITAAPQAAWNEALHQAIDEGMMFSPWHGLAAHRPLGSIMRVRKSAYEVSAKYRELKNGKPLREPRSLDT